MKKRIFNPYKWKRKMKRGSQNSSDIIDIESRLNIRPTLGNDRWKREIRHIEISPVQKRKFHIYFLITTILAIVGICFFHPFFSIRTIEIQGLERINEKDVYLSVKKILSSKKWFFLSSSNYSSLSKDDIIHALKQEYPFESIAVSKKFPHSLNIFVTEKPGAFLFDTGKEYILIGQAGERLETIRIISDLEWKIVETKVNSTVSTTSSTIQIIPQTIQTRLHTPDLSLAKVASKSYPMVYDPKGVMDQKTFSKEVVTGIKKWNQFLWEQQRIVVSYIELLENTSEGYIHTSAGWGIYVSFLNTEQAFPLFGDIFTQIDKNTLEYIDFRYLQRIYWK